MFKAAYRSNKWISLENWYVIDRKIEEEIEKNKELEVGETFCTLGNLKMTLSLSILEADKSSLKPDKNAFQIDRVLRVKIDEKKIKEIPVSDNLLKHKVGLQPTSGLQDSKEEEYETPGPASSGQLPASSSSVSRPKSRKAGMFIPGGKQNCLLGLVFCLGGRCSISKEQLEVIIRNYGGRVPG